jgi:hypothetical protein
MSVRWVVDNLLSSSEIEIACLEPTELSHGMTVVAGDVDANTKRCARTLSDGSFRVPIPTTIGDRIDVAIYKGAERAPTSSTPTPLATSPAPQSSCARSTRGSSRPRRSRPSRRLG